MKEVEVVDYKVISACFFKENPGLHTTYTSADCIILKTIDVELKCLLRHIPTLANAPDFKFFV